MIFVIILELRCDLDLLDEAGDHHCICRSPTPNLKIVVIVMIMIIVIIVIIIVIIVIIIGIGILITIGLIIIFVVFLIPGQRRYREQRQVSPEKKTP